MTIFAQPSIQSFLNALQGTLSTQQLSDLVHRLNLEDLDSLATEWEVCILFALMKLGRVTYEPSFAGKSRPDIHFIANDNTNLQCIADVTLISDSDLEEKNPFLALTQIVSAKAHKLGISGTFSFTVGHTSIETHGTYKVQLRIPHKKKLLAFIERNILPHLHVVAKTPNQSRAINVAQAPWDLKLLYVPGQQSSFGSYRAFRNATIKDKNPLYNALERKRKQLRDSDYKGCKGIIVCDGGCEVIQNEITSWDTYSRKQIVNEFFRKTRSISFVVIIWIEVRNKPGRDVQHSVRGEIEINPGADVSFPKELVDLFGRLLEFWPHPIQAGENARLQVEGYGPRNIPRFWGRRVGGYKMGRGPNRITYRMSARELLEILSGRRTIQEFERDAGFARLDGGGPLNPFKNALQRGFTISGAVVEAIPDRDDDWIEFQITGPDPALSRFRIPG
jgi:hypothetical protein